MARTAFADHPVEGWVAAGAAGGASENPLLMGGNDGGGLRRALLVSTAGTLQVGVSSSDLVVGPTSVTSATQVVIIALAGYYGVGVNITSAGSACTQVAEYSMDSGTTWTIAQLYNANTQAFSLSTTTTGQYGIVCPGGSTNVRMRVSVYGSGTVTDQLTATAMASPISTVQGSIINTDGTTIANVAPATGGQTGQGALQVAATYQSAAFSFGSAVAGTIYDCASYRSVSVQFTTNASANTIQLRTSNDATNWDLCNLTKSSDSTSVISAYSSASVPQVYYGMINGRYFQLNCSTFVSGTTTGTIFFSTLPLSPAAKTAVAQSGTFTVGLNATTTGGYSFSNMKTNTTTTQKSGAGTFHSITINTKGITNTATIYDNTAASGTTIATIDTTLGQATLIFDVAFATGLTCIVAGGTAADVTLTYK